MHDTIVIGGGLMGSAAAWHLSRRGEKVTLLENQPEKYTHGSSFGEARISRSLGPKKDIFSYLHKLSVAECEKLIDFLNSEDSQQQHAMDDIYRTSPVTYLYDRALMDVVHSILEDQQDSHIVAFGKSEASEKFQLLASDDSIVIREDMLYSGTINPKALIKKLHRAIQLNGGQIQYSAGVKSLIKNDDCYELIVLNKEQNADSKIEARKVIVAAGPYTGQVLKTVAPYFKELITPKRLYLTFLELDTDYYAQLSEAQKEKIINYYPVADLTGDIFYSMIECFLEDGRPLLKVGGHLRRELIDDLDASWKKEVPERELNWAIAKTTDYFNMLGLPIKKGMLNFHKNYACVYSLSESEIPIISNAILDGVAPDPNLVVMCALSGVGAKGALSYGKLAVDLLLNHDNPDEMYQITKKAMGYERLLHDLKLSKISNSSFIINSHWAE